MICNKCGNNLEEGAVFCPVCGANVGDSNSSNTLASQDIQPNQVNQIGASQVNESPVGVIQNSEGTNGQASPQSVDVVNRAVPTDTGVVGENATFQDTQAQPDVLGTNPLMNNLNVQNEGVINNQINSQVVTNQNDVDSSSTNMNQKLNNIESAAVVENNQSNQGVLGVTNIIPGTLQGEATVQMNVMDTNQQSINESPVQASIEQNNQESKKAKNNKRSLIIIVVAVIICVLIVIVSFVLKSGKSFSVSKTNKDSGTSQVMDSSNNKNETTDSANSSGNENNNIEAKTYNYTDIAPNRTLESGMVLLKIGNAEFNALDLTFGKVLNEFNSSVGLKQENIVDAEAFDPNSFVVTEKYVEEKSGIKISLHDDGDVYTKPNAKEEFLNRIVHEMTIDGSSLTIDENFSTDISLFGISIGMTKEEVDAVLVNTGVSESGIIYRYTDTESWLNEHYNLSIRYDDNNRVIRIYAA